MKERTTVRLDSELMRRARSFALAHGTTLTSLIEQSLRQRLSRREASGDNLQIHLQTFEGDGVLPGVRVDDGVSLRDRMDGLED